MGFVEKGVKFAMKTWSELLARFYPPMPVLKDGETHYKDAFPLQEAGAEMWHTWDTCVKLQM